MMDRRSFLATSSYGAAAVVSPFGILSERNAQNIRLGLIGAGWYGMVIANAALDVGGVEVISVCDVDSKHLKESLDELESKQGSRPKGYTDYLALLEDDNLDAILIGTQPHWHALQFVAASKKGLDIYCEKPLAYDVDEGKAMVAAARKAGNIVQVGFQRRQANSFAKVKSLIQEGAIGEVHHVKAQIHYNPSILDTAAQTPPPELDWENWCGPAPKLPYSPSIGHKAWRLEKEYGHGHLVDWGIHHIDIIRHILDVDMPHTFQSAGGIYHLRDKITTADTLQATMIYDKCPVQWEHRLWGTGNMDPQHKNGVFFYGTDATIFSNDRRFIILSNTKDAEPKTHEVESNLRVDHMADFLNAIKKQDKSLISCPIDEGYKSTAVVQLATIAYETSSQVKWDAKEETIVGNPTAKALLARPYRGVYRRPNT
ncbi:MAG: Gfo/Idh/MocA family oxidoreductase [Saprospiraceae bacterium]|nr:Gfo/Idh/MocA family oxidoreductase [Saprospiraceae bacterium]